MSGVYWVAVKELLNLSCYIVETLLGTIFIHIYVYLYVNIYIYKHVHSGHPKPMVT